MADDTYNNWDDARSGVIDSTLEAIRDQRDDKQVAIYDGVVSFSSQVFNSINGKHYVMGPIKFDNPFSAAPTMTFGQAGRVVDQTSGISISTTYIPFLVMPYMYKWNFVNGKVDGFWLGMYALTEPPAAGVIQNVHWVAKGKASAYLDQMTSDQWATSYDYSDTDFLTVDETAGDDSTSDGGSSDGSDF